MNRRDFLQGSSTLAGLGLLNGCAKHVAVAPAATANAPALPFYDMPRHHRSHSRGPGSHLPHYRVPASLPCGWTAFRRGESRRQDGRDELRPRRQRLVAAWGSADFATRKAMEARPGQREIAVIGAGALGLTAALTAQRMGYNVTIYAKERPPYVRSARATGSWTPDSRVALTSAAPSTFGADWEAMARTSFSMYQSYLGTSGSPIEWTDRYNLSDEPPPAPGSGRGERGR